MNKGEIKESPQPSAVRPIQRFSLAKPFLMIVILFVIAVFIRWIDNFVLRLDEKVGELILTKSLGFILVILWVYLTGRRLKDIGLHSRKVGIALLIGAIATIAAFVVGYGVDYAFAYWQGNQPTFTIGAIDPKMGVTGSTIFAIWLIACNFVNSFMEEGLFRGVMGRLARIRLSFWGTILFTSFMFGIWHLPWVAKYYMLGQIETGSEIAMAMVFNSIPQFLIGIVYGYFYMKTNNLWAPWIAHTISNSVLNVLHIQTTQGVDASMPLRMMTYLAVMFLSLFIVKRIARKNQLEEARPWE
jgi:membrane protease YdiL (CAAX protease family)